MTVQANLSGLHGFVTGASSGLGTHFAKVLTSCGAKITVAARRVDRLDSLVQEIVADKQQAHGVKLDVANADSVTAAIAEAVRVHGPIDILVNNAGTTSVAHALDVTEEEWDTVLDTNLKGAFLVATEVARTMRASNRAGSIINIASILGIRQTSSVLPYAVSKAGIIQMTQVLALELARFSIRVNAIAPGYFDTDINHNFWQSAAGAALVKRIPQRRLGAPSDLDGALLLLASPSSSYMTGSVITVDGGHLVNTL